jgi:microcystin-dependent protein
MFTEPYLGNITIFAGTFAPLGWRYCQGQLLSIAEYTALYSLIGTIYGGDGQETFALPDFRGRVAVHQGQGPGIVNNYTVGDQGGTEAIILNTANLPVHSHTFVSLVGGMPASADAGTLGTPVGNLPAATTGINSYNSAGTSAMKPTTNTLSTGVAGGTQPFNNASPVLAMNYIIAVEGIYPSRN